MSEREERPSQVEAEANTQIAILKVLID